MTDEPSEPEWIRAARSVPAWQRLERRVHRPGSTIFSSGEPGDEFAIVDKGACAVFDGTDAEHPPGDKLIAEIGPHALIGELALLTRHTRRHDVVARSEVVAYHGDSSAFEALLDDDAVAEAIGTVAARRLAAAVVPISTTTSKDIDVVLRPLVPDDRPNYLEQLERAPAETILYRFFTSARPTPAVVDRLLNIDYIHQFAWLAVAPDDHDDGWGIGRYVIDPREPEVVEVAVAVAEGAQGKGVGSLLVGAAAASADAVGFETMVAHVMSDNRAMRAVLDKAGAHWARLEPGVVTTRLRTDDLAKALAPQVIDSVRNATSDLVKAAEVVLA